ncbi:MAG TPA: hypothetical protein VK712_01085 [Verrucomicrobiae bacterium]|jgi:hypothetical protein|nr:hypothetical protein [Verrucomicrobiae bacterium]
MSDNDGVLLEDIDHKLQAILEGQAAMASMPSDIAGLKIDMAEVKLDIKVIQAAVKDQSKQHNRLVGRVTKLEQTVR